MLQKGIDEANAGNFLVARECFQSYLKDHPKSGRALRGIGNTYMFVETDVEKALVAIMLVNNAG